MTKHDERQETIKLCLRNAIDWEGFGNHKSAAFWRNVASEIQTVEALTAENERLRGALTTAKNALNLLSHGEGDDYRMEWLEEVLAKTRAALGDTQ